MTNERVGQRAAAIRLDVPGNRQTGHPKIKQSASSRERRSPIAAMTVDAFESSPHADEASIEFELEQSRHEIN